MMPKNYDQDIERLYHPENFERDYEEDNRNTTKHSVELTEPYYLEDDILEAED